MSVLSKSQGAEAPQVLHLAEIAPLKGAEGAPAVLSRLENVVRAVGGAVVESVWASRLGRLYVILEGATPSALRAALSQAELALEELAPVRLVGTPAAAAAPAPSHVVEWDLPAGLGLEKYLERKAEKSPLYARVPEVRFLRTYVREDAVKCLCLYDAPDDDAVRRARAAVEAPISRLDRVDEP